MTKERIAELRDKVGLAQRSIRDYGIFISWKEDESVLDDLLLLLDECEKTRAGDKETDPFLANLYGIKSRGSSNVGIEHQPDGPGSSPGPRSPAPLKATVTREFVELHAMAVYRAIDQHDAKVLMGHALREIGVNVKDEEK